MASANYNVTYPAQFQLAVGMHPCRCGCIGDPARACGSAPVCGRCYAARVSGPMINRFDLIIEVPEVTADMLLAPTANEPSHVIAQRVEAAWAFAATRQNQGADCVNA